MIRLLHKKIQNKGGNEIANTVIGKKILDERAHEWEVQNILN
jgi:hypothetical protein